MSSTSTTEVTTDRDALREIIRTRSFGYGVERKLASGRTSNFYFNMKPTMLHPMGAHLIGRLVTTHLMDRQIDAVGGLEMGAVPIAAAVAAVSATTPHPLPAFFVRKEAKGHGTAALIEGPMAGDTLSGQRLCVIEDVTTTGGSAIKAVETLKSVGAVIDQVLTIVDRQEGANEAFASADLEFHALFRAEEFLNHAA